MGAADVAAIRPGAASDADAIADVIIAAQLTWLSDDLAGYSRAELTADWAARLDSPVHRTFVVDGDHGLLGVASYLPERLSHQPSSIERDSAHLSTLFVAPSVHGTGVAGALHGAALASMAVSGYSTARLWVPALASRALVFYGRTGWAATERTTMFAGLLRLEYRRPVGRTVSAGG